MGGKGRGTEGQRPIFAAAAAAVLLTLAGPARAGPNNDAVLATFFRTWDDDAGVTPDAVRREYAQRVVYYGETLTNEGVYRNKRAFVRRWPERRYAVVPGSSREACDAGRTRCEVEVTLRYQTASPARGARAAGFTRVSLTLVREDGSMKIARESGRPAPAAGPGAE